MASSPAEPQTASEQTDKRRWNAFVCQDCRGIFRIPADYSGKGVVCPCCDRMLRIPRAGESLPGLVQQPDTAENTEAQQEYAPIDESDATEALGAMDSSVQPETSMHESRPSIPAQVPGGQLRRRKKHRDRSKDAENDWQQERGRKVRFSRRIPIYWWWGTAALGASIVIAVMVALLKEKPEQASTTVPSIVSAPVVLPPSGKPKSDAQAMLHLTQLNQGYAVMEKFFATDSIETLMPLLRPVAGLEEKVRHYYRSKPVKMQDYHSIEKSTSRFSAGHRVMQCEVRLQNQSTRTLTLIQVGTSYRVDWESWVGWCEMDIATLKRKRPTQLTEVRVIVEMVSYYNYDFPNSSELEWQSYRLTFAHSDEVVHGYIERSSPVNDAVRLASDQTSRPMTLRIRYRDETSHPSQVLIDAVVADSWVTDMPEE